jgi:hypothetical protein
MPEQGTAFRSPVFEEGAIMCRTFKAPDAGLLREGLKAGEQFQVEKLGKCQARCKGYREWRDALDEVKRFQPEYKTNFVRMLEGLLTRRLGVEIRFYTAVYSALDIFHGVDAFIEIGEVIVTVDVTINPQKTAAKADVVYHAEDGVVSLTDSITRVACKKAPRLARVA